MREEIMQDLYKTFNLSSRQGTGGMTFKYVPNEDVITRMNKVFKGNWSTTVVYKDVIEDQVLVEVQVIVVDPDTEQSFIQTGYGSSAIARFNSGPNQGKCIDIGNAYKGSLSKAIVNACTRWGVGLVKESNPYDMEEVVNNIPPAAVIPPTASMPSPMPSMTPPSDGPPRFVPRPETAPVVESQPPPVSTPTPTPEVVAPKPMPTPTVAETTTTFVPPMVPDQPVSAGITVKQEEVAPPTTMPTPVAMPKVPAPVMDAPVPATPTLPLTNTMNDIGISDVQRVALNGILTMNNADYGELAAEAFTANSLAKAVPSKEDLNYDEAVVVIKFGNDKYRKTR